MRSASSHVLALVAALWMIGAASIECGWAQDIRSVVPPPGHRPLWNSATTWNLGRIPLPGEWVLITAGTTVILDTPPTWVGKFQRIDIEGLLWPEITPFCALPVAFEATERIQIGPAGRILGYDSANVHRACPETTGVSVPIELYAPTVINEGHITGGNNFQGQWGQALWSSFPSSIQIGRTAIIDTMNPDTSQWTHIFHNTGEIVAGSGIMGEELVCLGGSVWAIVEDTTLNIAGGVIRSGDGYVSDPPPHIHDLAPAGDVHLTFLAARGDWWEGWWGDWWWWWWDEWWEPIIGTRVIIGDGGTIIGGMDDGWPGPPHGPSYSNLLWVEGCDSLGDFVSFSGPGTAIDGFGIACIRSWNDDPISTIRMTNLDEVAVRVRQSYLAVPLPNPASGGHLYVDYHASASVDMTGNDSLTVVLYADSEDFGGDTSVIMFSHLDAQRDVLLDPGVPIDSLCYPDPTFWASPPLALRSESEGLMTKDSRGPSTPSVGRLSYGYPDIPTGGVDFFLPSLGLPGDTAWVFLRFRKFGQQHTYQIQIQDALGYPHYPQTVWVSETDDPEMAIPAAFAIPSSEPVGTRNSVTISSATYPDGENRDTLRCEVVVVPPVKMSAGPDATAMIGVQDTLPVTVRNFSDAGCTMDIYSYSESWPLSPGMQSIWVPAQSSGAADFYLQVPLITPPGQTNWVAFRAEMSGMRLDFWDADTSVVTATELAPPEGLVIRRQSSNIILNWLPVGAAQSYSIYRSTDGPSGPWSFFASTSDTMYSSGIPTSEKMFYHVTSYRP